MPDAESLMKRARELAPALRERAARTDELRRMPPETIEDFRSAGLLRVVQPKKYGGMDLDYYVLFDLAVELGRASGSAAWGFSIWASHNWLVGTYPEKAQDEYWSDSPDTFASTSFDPTGGKVIAVEGGYRLSGRWSFASGCDEADWVMLAAIGSAGPILSLVPKPEFAVDDNWFVSGLRGTGSKDIIVEDTFVPEYRVVSLHDLAEAHSPGREVHDSVNYRFPLFTLFPYNLASPLVGMAQGVVDAFEEYTKRRISVFTGERVANYTSTQTRLAEAAAEVDAARLIMYRDDREVIGLARNHQIPSLDDRARYRRDHGYVTKLCSQAATRLFEASGGHALFEDGEIPRFHRDVLAASHHAALTWDVVAEQYGRVRLGLEPTDPFM